MDVSKIKLSNQTLLIKDAAARESIENLAPVATSGSYNDLTDKPENLGGGVQSDWNQADDQSPDFIKNKPTLVSAFNNDVGYLTADLVTLSQNVTHSELVLLRSNKKLVPGKWYRITDYQCTTVQDGTQSAGHQFDIIVRADGVNVLNENAYAAENEGDTQYFTYDNLAAWKLKYTIDNNTSKFAWADSLNGKGVIYYMEDAGHNVCYYDFKNIQFLYNDKYYYTFNIISGVLYLDNSLFLYKCFGNKTSYYINNKKYTLPNNLFTASMSNDIMYNNIIGVNSYNNIIKAGSCRNTIGDDCHDNDINGSDHIVKSYSSSNTIGGLRNILGSYCNNCVINGESNILGPSCSVKTGALCHYNVFGSCCSVVTLGKSSDYNNFAPRCANIYLGKNATSNTFGPNVWNITAGDYFSGNRLENYVRYIEFKKSLCQNITIESGNQYLYIDTDKTTSSSLPLRNITVAKGVNNTTSYKTIMHPTVGDNFVTTYQPTDSAVVDI